MNDNSTNNDTINITNSGKINDPNNNNNDTI